MAALGSRMVIRPLKSRLLNDGAGMSAGGADRLAARRAALESDRAANAANGKPRTDLKAIIAKVSLKKRRNIVGTCQQIEKPYFRLTAEADPAQVRPRHILEQSLELVRQRYAERGDYTYANDQLKSIRQDIITQDIRDDFAVSVYEEHVLLAIKHKDREEFNQSQQQLKSLYVNMRDSPNRLTFTAYRLLYYVYLLSKFKDEIESSEELSLARKVYVAYTTQNYDALLRLYAETAGVFREVMDFFIERERDRYLKCLLAAFKPRIPGHGLRAMLHMDEEELTEFLKRNGWALDDNDVLDVSKGAIPPTSSTPPPPKEPVAKPKRKAARPEPKENGVKPAEFVPFKLPDFSAPSTSASAPPAAFHFAPAAPRPVVQLPTFPIDPPAQPKLPTPVVLTPKVVVPQPPKVDTPKTPVETPKPKKSAVEKFNSNLTNLRRLEKQEFYDGVIDHCIDDFVWFAAHEMRRKEAKMAEMLRKHNLRIVRPYFQKWVAALRWKQRNTRAASNARSLIGWRRLAAAKPLTRRRREEELQQIVAKLAALQPR
ncbi:PCI domain-containing protein [Aphelenchoides fujianensis]|nr:PCI domain-containing protein [Aphelenchoides fujianensis]